jgi:thioredoxin 2
MNDTTAIIRRCPACGTRNKIPADKAATSARCGKCHALVGSGSTAEDASTNYTIRCLECKTRNRVPGHKIDAGAKCGKCGSALDTAELFIAQPVMVTDTNFEKTVMASPLPVLLFCWAPWCPTCGAVAPIIDDFARESKGKIRVGKVNIDTNQQIAARFNILSVPYLFIFDNGELKESLPGGMQKHQLMMKLAHYL